VSVFPEPKSLECLHKVIGTINSSVIVTFRLKSWTEAVLCCYATLWDVVYQSFKPLKLINGSKLPTV